MPLLLFAGECMLELRKSGPNQYISDFAGDTYNSAVYAKRWRDDLNVGLLTAIGQDALSQEMFACWKEKGLQCEFVLQSPDASPGIYMIDVDDLGERRFSYWRAQSAAKEVMKLLDNSSRALLRQAKPEYMYFSGISLAILEDRHKEAFIDLLTELASDGCKVSYDPNYRPKMWRDRGHAQYWNDKAYKVAQIVLPGLEDHADLYQHHSVDEIVDYLNMIGDSKEIIVKAGELGVYCYQGTEEQHHFEFSSAPLQVDTTAAGDSFAGTYLASRASNESMDVATRAAMKVAGFVVQQAGAIVPKAVYLDFKKGCAD